MGDLPKDFENSVWQLILQLTPSAITIGRDPSIKLSDATFRPDILALFEENRFLLCECKFTISNAFVSNWLSEFRSVRRDLEAALKKSGYSQFIYLLFVQDKSKLEDHVRTTAENLRVKLVDDREVRYFHSLQKQSGIGISPIFWARVAPSLIRNQELRVPALRIKTHAKREAFIFSLNAHDLLKRSFVSHRELHSLEEGEIGFQRMLQKKKLAEVAEYIKDRNVFPTPVVVAFSKRSPAVFEPIPISQKATDDMRQIIEFGHLRLPKQVNSIQIIDGQHRLYGYSKLPWSEKHIVHVLAYRDESGGLASMFVDINSKQTKVPSSLLWELYPDIFGEDDPEYWKAEISSIVEAVSCKLLPTYVQHISSGMQGPISFQTLCSEVNRAKLLDVLGDKTALQTILEAFFTTLIQLGEKYADVNANFVFSNNGIVPMIRTSGRIIQFEKAHNRSENLKRKTALQDTFNRYFEPIYKKYASFGVAKLREMRKRTGNSGFNQTEDEITEIIRSGYLHNFPYRPKKTPPQWEAAVDRCAALIVSMNREAMDSGRLVGFVFRDFDPDRFKRELSRPIDGEDAFERVLTILFKEILEGSGKDGPDSRVKSLLGVSSVYEIPVISELNVLRTYWGHNRTQVDAGKRQKALLALGKLSMKQPLVGVSELDKTEWQKAAISLLERINDELLDKILVAIRIPKQINMA